MSEALSVANVFMSGQLAGQLVRNNNNYTFRYDKDYILNKGKPLSYSLPIQYQAFYCKSIFAYFGGLVSEGWLLELQSRTQHIDKNDVFALLIKNGHDLAGAITIELSSLSERL